MIKKEFERDIFEYKRNLEKQKSLGKVYKFFTLGIFNNNKKIRQDEERYTDALNDLDQIAHLEKRVEDLNKEINSKKLNDVRIGRHIFSDISVLDNQDYGVDWESLRENVLTRDDRECQESDGYCKGVLQIHHIIPLSRGGANDQNNLITLCKYHHSLKHKHMQG